MVTFVANVEQTIEMETLSSDLEVLVDANAVWFNAGPIFTATSSTGFLKVAGYGGLFNNAGGKPGTGAIDKLTVIHGSIVPTTQYTIKDLGTTFEHLQTALTASGAEDAFREMFADNDKITGSGGDDHLFGFTGKDTIHGGDGKDVIDGDQQDDDLYGEDGDDHLNGGTGNDTMHGGDGDDVINGGFQNDYLYGDYGQDHLNGGFGNDALVGGIGKDVLDGGADNDTALYDSLYTSVVVKLAGAAAADVVIDGQIEDTVINVENIYGGHAADALTGDGLGNVLYGNGGGDRLKGAGGADSLNGGNGKDLLAGGTEADLLNGGNGNDTLVGGKGNDTFFFASTLKNNVDTIKDFSPGDEIRLSHYFFPSIAVGSHNFFAVDAAKHAGDHIIYHAGTGDLFYDADGNGAGAAVKFAHLAGHPALTGADFIVTA